MTEIGSAGRRRSTSIPSRYQRSSVLTAMRWRRSCNRGPWESPGLRRPIRWDSVTKVARTAQCVRRTPRSDRKTSELVRITPRLSAPRSPHLPRERHPSKDCLLPTAPIAATPTSNSSSSIRPRTTSTAWARTDDDGPNLRCDLRQIGNPATGCPGGLCIGLWRFLQYHLEWAGRETLSSFRAVPCSRMGPPGRLWASRVGLPLTG